MVVCKSPTSEDKNGDPLKEDNKESNIRGDLKEQKEDFCVFHS